MALIIRESQFKANLNNVNVFHSGSKFAWKLLVCGIRQVEVMCHPQKSLQLVCILGAGLLCGTALAIVIPEGVSLLEESYRGEDSRPLTDNPTHHPLLTWVLPVLHSLLAASSSSPAATPSGQNASNSTDPGTPARVVIGLALTFGFTLMFVVDQISTYFSTRG